MNKRKKRMQIMAVIGLIGIFFSIVGTGLLVIFSSRQPSLTEEELQEYLKSMSGTIEDFSVDGQDLEEESFSGVIKDEEQEDLLSGSGEEDLEINE